MPWKPGPSLERARVVVRGATGEEFHFDNLRLLHAEDNRRIWLHTEYGERLFLFPHASS